MKVSQIPDMTETEKVDPTSDPFQANNNFNDSVTESILVNVEFEEKLIAEALTQMHDISNTTFQRIVKVDKDETTEDDSTNCRNSTNLNLLQSVFPNCRRYLSHTECQGSSDLSKFGFCLVKSYPETRVLSLSQTLTSGKVHSDHPESIL